MGKTAAERKREQRERLKANGRYENFKENESRKQKERRIQKKNKMTIEEKDTLRANKREEMRKYRAKKAITTLLKAKDTPCSDSISPSKVFTSPHSFGKAIARVRRNLPKSPNKSKAVIKKLAHQLLPDLVQPLPKSRTTKLDENIKLQVKAFFEKDSITYQAPGTKDFVIVKDTHGKKSKIQKRYLCITLGEAYEIFKNENCDIKIGRSKFCEYRPPYICLRHETPPNLCLCIYHENIRLILEGISLFPNCTSNLVKMIICEESTENCYYQTCNNCGNLRKLHSIIDDDVKTDIEAEIKLFQWMKDETNIITKQKICLTLNEAIEKLKEKLPQFLQHVYVKQQQELFFENMKKDLQLNTLLLHFDFSENYSFFSQDEIQSAHWTSTSCTIYTSMAYFIYGNTLRTVPIVVVSNYLHHDKYAVTIFNNAIIEKIKNDFPQLIISKIIYKSDGTAQHFKQKYSICLAMLRPGDVEWHFTATGHGKGPVDGVGETVKRRVREATLSRKINPGSAEEFFHSAKNICKNVTLLYISEIEVEDKRSHFDQLCSPTGNEIFSIPNTRKLHCFIKVTDYIVKAANVSLKPKNFVKINLQTGEVETEINEDEPVRDPVEINVGNWILVPFPGKCKVKYFAGQVIDKENLFIKVKFLQKKGNSFTWPSKDDISDVDINDMNIQKLPEPNFDRRSYLMFENYNFSNYVMG